MAKDDIQLEGITPITAESFNQPAPGLMRNIPAGFDQAPSMMPGNVGTPMPGLPPVAAPVGSPQNPVQAPVQQIQGALTGPLPTGQYMAKMVSGLEGRKDITGDEASNLAAGQANIGNIYGQAAADQAQSLKAQQQIMAESVAKANQSDAQVRSMIQKAYAEKVDPDHYWAKKSTPEKVLAAIGVFLSGWGAGLNKTGGNQALSFISKAIDDDIAAQKSNIDNAWKAIDKTHSLAGDSFQKDLHRQNMENTLRVGKLEAVKLQLAEAGAKTSSESVKNNAQMAIQDLTDKQLAIRNQQYTVAQQAAGAAAARYDKLAKERRDASNDLRKAYAAQGYDVDQIDAKVNQQMDAQYPMLRGTPYASQGQQYQAVLANATATLMKSQGLSREDAEKTAQGLLDQHGIKNPYAGAAAGSGMVNKEDKARAVIDPLSGQQLLLPDKEIANKYRTESAGSYGALDAINTIKNVRAKHGGGFNESLNPDDALAVTRAKDTLIALMNQEQHGGILQQADVVRIGSTLPSFTGSSWYRPGKDIDQQIGALEASIRNGQASRIRAYSGQAYVPPTGAKEAPKAGSSAAADPFTPYGGGSTGGSAPFTPSGSGGFGGAGGR